MSQIQVNSEKIMKEIQTNLTERSMGQYSTILDIPKNIAEEDIFNREVDVAAIMHKICSRYQKNMSSVELTTSEDTEQENLLKEVMYEIERINEYVFHNNMHAANNLLAGTVIEPEKPITVRDKIVVFMKRIVRKATAFLMRDQAKVNEYFVNSITGLRESQMQNYKVVGVMHQMILVHEQEKFELQKQIDALNDEILQLKKSIASIK